MARKIKPAILVFCEGETEIEYAKWLKDIFFSVVAIQTPAKVSFEDVLKKVAKNKKYANNISDIDEIWLFFDVDQEQGDQDKWESRLGIIKELRKLKKKPNIKVRLLMTTACVEYWLLLHYIKTQTPIMTAVDKEAILNEVVKQEPAYKKGDATSILSIAENYKEAVKNGQWVVERLREISLPRDESEDAINEWLYKNSQTFTNVHETILFLESL